VTGAVRGRIVALDEERVYVEVPGLPKPVAAELAVVVDPTTLRGALDSRQPTVLVFENGDRAKPIIVGFIAAPVPSRESARLLAIEANVDGRRIRVVAKDELVLECGKASITLRRNGRVVVRGTHVETDSQGTNRIKGGQVRIN